MELPLDVWYEIFTASNIAEKSTIAILNKDINIYVQPFLQQEKEQYKNKLKSIIPPDVGWKTPIDYTEAIRLMNMFNINPNDICHPETRVTILMHACFQNKTDIIKKLLSFDIDVNRRDIHMANAFLYWCMAGHEWAPNLTSRIDDINEILDLFEKKNVDIHIMHSKYFTVPSYYISEEEYHDLPCDSSLYNFIVKKGGVCYNELTEDKLNQYNSYLNQVHMKQLAYSDSPQIWMLDV